MTCLSKKQKNNSLIRCDLIMVNGEQMLCKITFKYNTERKGREE